MRDKRQNRAGPKECRRVFLKLTAAAGVGGGLLTSTAGAVGDDERDGSETGGTVVESTSNEDILDAIATDEFRQAVDGTEYVGVDSQIERFEQEIQNFPRQSTAFAVLSSGVAADAPGDPDEFANTDLDGREIPNYSPDDFDAFNIAEFRIDFTVPDSAESIAFDYKFGTDESPTFLDTQFQDFFEAALILPDGTATNIARLPDEAPVTVDNADDFANTPNGSSPDPMPPLPDPQDTVYNAVSDLQTAERSVSGFDGEELTLVLRIADASDRILDSAAFIDNVRFGGDVEDPLRPIRDAFDDWRLAVESVSEGLVRSEARAQAEVYAEHGSEYAQPMIDMLGHRAGEVPASELDDEFLQIDEDVSADFDSSVEQVAYEFYQEMFGQVSPSDDPTDIAETFVEYMLGTHDNQSNYLLTDERTVMEAITYRVEGLDEYEDQFVSDVQSKLDDGEYSGAEIQKIASFIEQKVDYIFELGVEAMRDELATVENFTGSEELKGDITITELEEETQGEVSTSGITASAIIVGIALKKVLGAAITKKAGLALIKGIKSSGAATKIATTAKSYGIGTSAKTAWLSNKSSTIATFVTKNTPSWARTLGWFGVDLVNPLVAKPKKWLIDTADSGFEYVIGWPPAAQLDSFVHDVVVDGTQETVELSYTGPEAVLLTFKKSVSIDSVSVSDIGPTDYDEGLWPAYGRETGEVTVTNTGSVAFEPRPEGVLYAKAVQPAGLTLETNYPVVFPEPIPTLEPGESATIEFEYAVPIAIFTSGYEVRIGFSQGQGGVKASDSFEAGVFSPLSAIKNVASGLLSDGESEFHGYQTGQVAGVQTAQQGLYSVTFKMEYSGFNADLHLYDKDGNHVGQNYEAGEFENQIGGAKHSGHEGGALGNEWVTVENPAPAYDIEVVVPEVETIVQTESTESQAQLAQQNGGGTVEYDIEAIETPRIEGKLDAAVSQAAFDQADESAETVLAVSEVSEQERVSNVTVSVDELVRDDADISGEKVTFSDQAFSLDAGQTRQVDVEISQPEELLPGTYSGPVTMVGNDGNVTTEETIGLVVEPLVPYVNTQGIVETGGLRDAIDDLRADKIDTELLRGVMDAWQSGDSVA